MTSAGKASESKERTGHSSETSGGTKTLLEKIIISLSKSKKKNQRLPLEVIISSLREAITMAALSKEKML